MIRTLTIMSIIMAMALMLHTISWADNGLKIQLNAVAEMEVKAMDTEGRTVTKRVPAEKAIPGSKIIYTITYHNPADHPAELLVITNPIPQQMHYRSKSAFGSGAVFSMDNGHSFDRPENLYLLDATGNRYLTKPSQYTHIRWQLQKPVRPQASGRVGFSAILQ